MNSGGALLNHSDEPKQHRACQACRVSKVRCRRPDDDQSCARCSKSGRPCVPSEESNKRQKRVDTRSVDDIEARLDVLTNILQDRGVNTSATLASTAERTTELDPHQATALLNANRTTNPLNSPPTELSAAQVGPSICDIVDDETTTMIFEHFMANMLQHFPFVAFSSDLDAVELRQTAPVLLLAILDAAGDGYYDMKTSHKLRKCITQTYSGYSLGNNADSITMLQALVISVLWNRDVEPPQARAELKVFRLCRAAADVAMEMGLETRLRNWSWNTSLPIQSDRLRDPTSEYQFSTLESRRLWLACYYICSNASLATQTQNLTSWSRQMDECVEVLSTSPAALASDKLLCAHVKLQHILEEFEAQLSPGLGPTAVEIAQRVAKRQLAEWATMLSTWNDSLESSQHFVILYIHELAMTTTPLVGYAVENGADAVTISQSGFTDCLTATQNSLNSFLSLDMPLIRTLPTSYFVQLTHTALLLVKLHFTAARLSNHADAAQKIVVTRAGTYLERLLAKCSGWGTLWPARKLVEALRRLRELLRQCGDQRLAPELAWLNAWTLKEVSSFEISDHLEMAPEQFEYGEKDAAISQSLGSVERATLSTLDENAFAWSASATGQLNDMQNVTQPILPSASLDATQLIDWFGTDLNTSTFDFDGNLQSMVQFFD